jgi:hypothetical protein
MTQTACNAKVGNGESVIGRTPHFDKPSGLRMISTAEIILAPKPTSLKGLSLIDTPISRLPAMYGVIVPHSEREADGSRCYHFPQVLIGLRYLFTLIVSPCLTPISCVLENRPRQPRISA